MNEGHAEKWLNGSWIKSDLRSYWGSLNYFRWNIFWNSFKSSTNQEKLNLTHILLWSWERRLSTLIGSNHFKRHCPDIPKQKWLEHSHDYIINCLKKNKGYKAHTCEGMWAIQMVIQIPPCWFLPLKVFSYYVFQSQIHSQLWANKDH